MTFLTRIPSAVVTTITANTATANTITANTANITGNLTGGNIRTGSNLNVQLAQGNSQINLRAPTNIGNGYSLVFPVNDGEANYVLATDGSGGLSWVPQVGDKFTVTDITRNDPGVVIVTENISFTNGQPILLFGVEGMTQVNNQDYFAGNVTQHTFALYADAGLTTTVDTTGFTAYSANGEVALRSLGVPGGAQGAVQFNSNGAFGGSTQLIFDSNANRLTANNLSATGQVAFTGNLVNLGAIANLRIGNASNGQIIVASGNAGNIAWSNLTVANISNGNSNVTIANAGGNVTVSVAGNSNIVTVTGTGVVLDANTQTTIANSNIRLSASNVSLGAVGNIRILGGNANSATAGTATIIAGAVSAVPVTGLGDGYTSAPAVTITGDGTGAAAISTINASGEVTAIIITNGGSGYTTASATIAAPTSKYLRTNGLANPTLSWSELDVNKISNIASNVTIAAANGNVTFGVAGNANVLTVTGTTSIANSFTSNNYILGNSTTTISTQRWFGAATASNVAAQVLYQVPAATIASMDFHITATEGSNSRQVSKFLIVNLGTETSYTEYGGMWVGPQIVDLTADQAGGNIRLLADPLTASTIQYNIVLTTYNN